MNRLLLATAAAVFAASCPHAYAQDILGPGATYNWSGFYAGSFAGGGKAKSDITSRTEGYNTDTSFAVNLSDRAANIGSFAGFNWQAGNFVFGAETELGSFHASSDKRVGGYDGLEGSFDMSLLGSTRARVGFALENILIYATGGLAYTDGKYSWTAHHNSLRDASGGHDFKTGYVVGGGAEYGITPNLSVRAEALYYDFGKDSFQGETSGGESEEPGSERITGTLSATVARIGITYRF
ncbi:outer membrane protein [Rhizobium sp. PAMB 3174]